MGQRVLDSLSRPWRYAIGSLLLLGMVLSLLSFYHVCSSACAEGHKYRIFGLHFETVGLAFFAMALLFFALMDRYPLLGELLPYLIAGGVGAEVWFLYVQKVVIQKWCPLCLSIAACVLALAAIYIGHAWIMSRANQVPRSYIVKRIAELLAFALLGFGVAFFGVYKAEKSFAEPNEQGESPIFGKQDSDVTLYFFTDWFCPACKKAEPSVIAQAPKIMQEARLVYVDVPIHEESLNFLPYNLSFMLKDKAKYPELRKALQELAEKDKNPTDTQVQAIAQRLGTDYEELGFSQLNMGLKYFKKMAKKYQINSTPSIVIVNKETGKTKKLEGASEIQSTDLVAAVKQLQ